MRPFSVRVLVACLLFVWGGAWAGAAEGYADSSEWWASIPLDQRYAIQSDLILLGHYDGFVDGIFGPATLGALTRYQTRIGDAPVDGTLTSAALRLLRQQGGQAYLDMDIGVAELKSAGVSVYVPRAILTQRSERDGSLIYASADGEFELYLSGSDYGGEAVVDLARNLLTPSSERTVTYKSTRPDRVVVSGRQDGQAYYSLLVVDGNKLVSLIVLWTDRYASAGAITAAFAASYSGRSEHFDREASTTPTEPAQETASAVPEEGVQIGSFFLPSSSASVVILNADIQGGAALDFRRAMKARPGAKTMVLASNGGSVNEALLVAHQVADLGLETVVPKGAGCYSACAYVFFAGKTRVAAGQLGVHQIYGDVDASGAQFVLSDVLDALDEFGVPQQVVSEMLRTPPDQMHIFSPSELALLEINRGASRAVSEVPDGLTVVHKNSLINRKLERSVTIWVETPLVSILRKLGTADGPADAISRVALAFLGKDSRVPSPSQVEVLLGPSSDEALPYRVSVYESLDGKTPGAHLGTVALTDRGKYVLAQDPHAP